MNAAHVSVTSADPEELTSELAIATAEFDEPPAVLRVNGMALTPLVSESDWPDPPRAWSLDSGDQQWTMVVHAQEEWQVLDIFRCVDIAEKVDAADSAHELFITPLASGWVVVEADPSGQRELVLHAHAEEASVWRTRDAALAAVERFTKTRTGHNAVTG